MAAACTHPRLVQSRGEGAAQRALKDAFMQQRLESSFHSFMLHEKDTESKLVDLNKKSPVPHYGVLREPYVSCEWRPFPLLALPKWAHHDSPSNGVGL